MNQTKRFEKSKIIYRLASVIVPAIWIVIFCISDVRGESQYEAPGGFSAQSILPPELLKGNNFKVADDVVSYGFTNYYSIITPFGVFEAQGNYMLQTRILEAQAIAALEEIKKTKAFSEAAKKAAMNPIKGAWSLIKHPVGTVSGVPKGLWKYMTRVGEMVQGDRGETEDSITKELVGFSKIKRQYAFKLGVDVYSSNEVLQKALNSVSWAAYSGGMGVTLLTAPISGAAGVAIKLPSFARKTNLVLRDNSPEDLRRANRKILEKFIIEKSDVEEFLRNPYISPRHETFIAHALANMEGVINRDQLIKQAIWAESEEDALLFQRTAELLQGYHKHVKPIYKIIPFRRVVAGYTDDQSIVIILPIDYLQWTKRTALGLKAINKIEYSLPVVNSVELWFSGKVSPKAKQELKANGIKVHSRINDKIYSRISGK